MWFKYLAFMFGLILIIKSCIGLGFHSKFYMWDKKQYSSPKPTLPFIFFLIYGLIILCLTWYATLFHYVKYGWILTAITTISGFKIYKAAARWPDFSKNIAIFIDKHNSYLWALDIILFILGAFFLVMSFTLYS